jgi:hypothetical protein
MNVEITAEAALFTEKEYISGIFVAVWGIKTTLKGRGEWGRPRGGIFSIVLKI